MTSLIDLQHVTKIYRTGEVEVVPLRDVSLAIERGETVAITGPSGCGKTTLMNVIGCVDRPTAGRYLLDGEDVSCLTRDAMARIRNRTFGFVFQSFQLLPRTTALDNVEVPLFYTAHVMAAERHRRALEALARVGLADRVRHFPGQLSGGQQQRVAIARAIVTRPSVILADEPTGNLDSRSEHEIMTLFESLGADGATIVIVTHNEEIAAWATRRIRMRDGQILDPASAPAEPAGSAPAARATLRPAT